MKTRNGCGILIYSAGQGLSSSTESAHKPQADNFDNNILYGKQWNALEGSISTAATYDKNEYVTAVLMDLSKAFDCLPQDMLLSKSSAYGLCAYSVELLKSYLSDRKQQIKLNNIVSSWSEIKKGVPQGSIVDPLLFDVFINDTFFIFKTWHSLQLCG